MGKSILTARVRDSIMSPSLDFFRWGEGEGRGYIRRSFLEMDNVEKSIKILNVQHRHVLENKCLDMMFILFS